MLCPVHPFATTWHFPSRGNEKIGSTGYCVTYDTDSQSRNVLASPLGEEGHEVAKGWTVVILIMILDVDVTAERRHYNTHRPQGRYQNPRPEGPSNLRTLRPIGPVHLKNLHARRAIHNPRGAALSTLTPQACPWAEPPPFHPHFQVLCYT